MLMLRALRYACGEDDCFLPARYEAALQRGALYASRRDIDIDVITTNTINTTIINGHNTTIITTTTTTINEYYYDYEIHNTRNTTVMTINTTTQYYDTTDCRKKGEKENARMICEMELPMMMARGVMRGDIITWSLCALYARARYVVATARYDAAKSALAIKTTRMTIYQNS